MNEAGIAGIRACVFDAYGTLFDIHAPVAEVAGRIGGSADALSRLWRQKQLEYTWLRALMPAHVDFWQVTGDALDFALETHGIDDPSLRRDLMELYLTLSAYDDAVPALEALKAGGLATGILSNGTPAMLKAAVGSAGLAPHLDAVLSVEDAGIFKPSPKVYQLVPEQMKVSPDEVCFVSTNGWDAAAAAHFGFQVVWLNRFGVAREKLPGTPRAVIDGLDALPALVNLPGR
ncbi:Haloacid dehalogenase, type II [hydrothermal vent metagenome]|uniref:Haloacid dehalogenase, type II n=1 Tax=hydrothermal vent metagenome TaxID=652676 RepID=A0A3B0U7Z4_9ZZZZ